VQNCHIWGICGHFGGKKNFDFFGEKSDFFTSQTPQQPSQGPSPAGQPPKISENGAKSALRPPTSTQTSVTLLQMATNGTWSPKKVKKRDFLRFLGHFPSFLVIFAQNRYVVRP
jgi:hypothetical protein